MPDTIPETDPMTDMIQMAQSGDPAAMMSAMVEQGRLTPERASLLQMMMQSQGAAELIEDAEVVDDLHEPPELRRDVSRILATADRRIGTLEALVATVADALGACPKCLGTDDDCATCDGYGEPGQARPDRQALEYFVLPVLNRLKRPRRNSAGHPTADRGSRPANVTHISN